MYGQGNMINRRPNMNVFNAMNAGRDIEDDDDDDYEDPVTSSFTKSKVDDDDEKFKDRSDQDFLEFLMRKKALDKSPNKGVIQSLASAFVTPSSAKDKQSPQESSQKILLPVPSPSKVVKPLEPKPTPPIKIETPSPKKEQSPIKPFVPKTPEIKLLTPVQKTPDPPKKIPEVKTPVIKTPEVKAVIAKSPVKPIVTSSPEVKKQIVATPKVKTPEPKVVISTPVKVEIVKPIEVKIDGSKILVSSDNKASSENTYDDRIGNLIRPQFVRKGKTTATVLDLAKKIESDGGDNRIRAIEPRNPKCVKDVSREYVMRNNPNYYGGPGEGKYDDHLFPANLSLVYQLPSKMNRGDANRISFERSEKTYMQRSVEPLSVVDPNDITPGQFETWNLMSALACIAERPQLISRLLEQQRVNKDGYYYVRLCVDGVWRYSLVDDFLPFRDNVSMNAGPAQDGRIKKLVKTAPGYKSELWVSLIEKAVSKIFGSYEDLERSIGSLKDDMYLLTGSPSYEYKLQSTTDLHNTLIKLHPEALVVFQLRSKEKIESFRERINESHLFGYALITYDQKKQSLLLRNPWGWLKDPTQSKAVVKLVGDEGEFSISTADVIKFFDVATITNYHDDYYTVSIGVRQLPNCYSAYSFTVASSSQCYLTYTQLDQRYFRNNLKAKYAYSFARLMVFDQDDKLIVSNQGATKDLSVRLNVEAGRYNVVVCVDWVSFKTEGECPHDSTLTYYGSQDCELVRINQKVKPNQFAELVAMIAIERGEKRNFGSSSSNFHKNITEYVWVGEEERIIVITWWSTSTEPISYRRDFRNVLSKDQLIPLCFINSKEIKDALKLTSLKQIQKRKMGWWESTELDVDFPSNSVYSVVFKPSDLNQPCTREFLKEMALL